MTSPFLSGMDSRALHGGMRINDVAAGGLFSSRQCEVCGADNASCHRQENPDLEGVGMPPRRRITPAEHDIETPETGLVSEDTIETTAVDPTFVEVKDKPAVKEVPLPEEEEDVTGDLVEEIVEIEERPPGAPRDGRIVWAGDPASKIPVRRIAEGLDIVEVREDVWKAAILPNTKNRIGYTLLIAKGEQIQLTSLDTVIQ